MSYPAKLLGEGEDIVLEMHPHWKQLVPPILKALLGVGVASFVYATVGGWSTAREIRWGIVVVTIGLLVWGSLVPYLRWRTTQYVVTTKRVVIRTGILSRHGRDIPLHRVNDVSFSVSLFERIVRSGTLTVESAGERGQVVLTDVPHVEEVQRTIYRLAEAAEKVDEGGDGT